MRIHCSMTSEGETSETLSTLIRTNDVEGAKTLLEGLRHSEAKALVCKQDKHLRTALHLAAWKGSTEMTELLLTHRCVDDVVVVGVSDAGYG